MSELAFNLLVSASELLPNINNSSWAVIDCRFDLLQPEWGILEYEKSHIPGAIYAHLDRDFSSPITPQTGRHPLPDIQEMAKRLGQWGIGQDTQVVVYDTTGGSYASRIWWMLRFLGHTRVAIFDGGLRNWVEKHLPLSTGIETRKPTIFTPKVNWSMLVDAEVVEKLRQDPAYLLIDARAPERFRGEKEPIDPIAGHIPGAVNRFHGLNLAADGTFLPIEDLQRQFNSLLDGKSADHVIVYCGSGVTSCHHILAMELAGLNGAKLYAGSWSEWIRDHNRPIAK